MRRKLLIVLVALFGVTASAQQTVTPPADALYYDYVLTGVANWPDNPAESLQDPVYVAVSGNDVYVSGLCGFLPDAWVKGTRDGSTVTFAKNQYFGYDSTYGAGPLYFLGLDENNTAADVVFSFDEATGVYRTATWVLVSAAANSLEPYYYISDATLTPGKAITDEPVEVPGGLTTRDYELTATKMWYEGESFRTEDISRYVRIGITGSDVYVQGLCEQLPYCWVKGSISGEDATFGKGQFYGVYTDQEGSYPLYFGGNYFGNEFTDMQWDYVANTGVFTRVTTYMVLNSEKDSWAPYEQYANAKLTPMADNEATPADPSVVEFQPFLDYMNAGYIRLDIPKTDTGGKALALPRLGYTLYSDIDGVVSAITFKPEEYEGLAAATTVLPYEQYNGQSIFLGGSFVMLYSWMQDFDRIGVQSVYTGGGKENRSNIVWYSINPSAVNSLTTDAPVVEESYYDLQGRRVSSETRGLIVKKVTRSDGSVKAMKVHVH